VPTETVNRVYRDSAGNVLQDGNIVTVINDLKLKGSAGVIKMGAKVKNIRLEDSDHDIDCKIDGFGAISLKSEFVKKARPGASRTMAAVVRSDTTENRRTILPPTLQAFLPYSCCGCKAAASPASALLELSDGCRPRG
jgi:hypothetical protein